MCEIWSSACTKRNEPFPARAHRLKHGPWLNAPWGVALAPPNFGFFSSHLLIGDAGSRQIAVYDVDSGRFDDLLRDANGHATQKLPARGAALWQRPCRRTEQLVVFLPGISDEAHGLLGLFTLRTLALRRPTATTVRSRIADTTWKRLQSYSPWLPLTCIPLSSATALRSRKGFVAAEGDSDGGGRVDEDFGDGTEPGS